MSPRRLVVALSLTLGLAYAAAALRDPEPPRAPADTLRLSVSSPAPAPSATPLPWRRGLLAVDAAGALGRDILLLDMSGTATAPRLLGQGYEALGGLSWSPSGDWLAYAARVEGNWDVYRLPRAGGAAERLTSHPGFDGAPSWAPDGGALAFESYRDADFEIYRLAFTRDDTALPPERVTNAPGLDIEPAWLDASRIAWARWDGERFRLVSSAGAVSEAVDPPGQDGNPPDPGSLPIADGDIHLPQLAPDGRRLAFLDRSDTSHTVRIWDPVRSSGPRPRALPITARAAAFAWSPDSAAIAVVQQGRGGSTIEAASLDGSDRAQVASLPQDAGALAWTAGSMPAGLPEWRSPAPEPPRSSAESELRAGLARLDDVAAPGARMNAALVEDFEALRAETRSALGSDFLGELSDLWRPLGYSGSSFFSWHKTGRAFDIIMDFDPPGGGTGMVILRESGGGRTLWRIYLRAAAQDGSVGAPLRLPGWDFYARHGGDPEAERNGGKRNARIPAGYYVDFTAMAARHGWQRIASVSRPGFDWRRDWAAIDFWHFERKDGLSWYAAARQVYDDATLAAELNRERLQELGQARRAYGRVGVPPDLAGPP